MKETITIDGLSMRETDEPLVKDPNGNDDWFAYPHQVESRKLFNGEGKYEHDSCFVMNCMPTGGGKTMSWLDPVVRNEKDVLVILPTKTLIQDQKDSAKEIIENRYEKGDSIGLEMFTSDTFKQMGKNPAMSSSSNGVKFETRLRQLQNHNDNVIAFTNPDVFSLLRHGEYDKDSFARKMSSTFDVVVVDEFHYFDMKGQHSLIALLDQMRNEDSRHSNLEKVMLLSATPNERIQKKLENMDGFYDLTSDEEIRPFSEVSEKDDWRAIMPPVDLTLKSGQTFQNAQSLLAESNIQHTINFCHQENRTVIMLDALQEVNKVYAQLSNRLQEYEVMKIHGWTSNEGMGEKLKEFNDPDTRTVLVTNAASEVGVDFDIDQMIFSAQNPSKMLQRFGRIRTKSEKCRAIAYVPLRVVERFKELDMDEMKRDTFRDEIEASYPTTRRPDSYVPTFGAHEAYEQVRDYAEKREQQSEEEIIKEGKEMVNKQFFEPYDVNVDWDEFQKRHDQYGEYLDELKQFRSNQPQLLVYDTEDERVSAKNLFAVIRTGDIDVVSRNEFFEMIPEEETYNAKKEENHTHGYVVYRGNEVVKRGRRMPDGEDPTARSVYVRQDLTISTMLDDNVRERLPQRMTNFQIVVDEGDLSPIDVEPINEELEDANPLVYAIEQDKYSASKELHLDDFFFLTPVLSRGESVSIAFSHNALYLMCIKQENSFKEFAHKKHKIRVPNTVFSL